MRFLAEGLYRITSASADRETSLQCRTGAQSREPTLQVSEIIKCDALPLMRHDPWKAGDISDRILASDAVVGEPELVVKDAVKSAYLLAVPGNGIRKCLGRIEEKMPILSCHRSEP